MTRWGLGDAAGAHELLEEVYEAAQRVLGPEDPNTLAWRRIWPAGRHTRSSD